MRKSRAPRAALGLALLAMSGFGAPGGARADATITVTSQNPASGVLMSSCCSGMVCAAVVVPTPFSFQCPAGTNAQVSAAPDAGGRPFTRWLRDGLFLDVSRIVETPADADMTLTAVYGEPPPPPGPDLQVTGVFLAPASPHAGTTFEAEVTVTNVGTATAGSAWLDIWADRPAAAPCGSLGIHSRLFGPLAPGASTTFTFSSLAAGAPGAAAFRAFADSRCAVAEADETNNQVGFGYTVQATPLPNFRVAGIAVLPPSPTAGLTFRAAVTVANGGPVAGDAGRLAFSTNSSLQPPCGSAGPDAPAVGVLAPGESRTITLEALPAGSAGAKSFLAFVDADCAAEEISESDNAWVEPYTVASRTYTQLAVDTLDGRAVELTHGADLGGRDRGVTSFTRQYEPYGSVTLGAPPIAPDGGAFQRWVVDDAAGPASPTLTLSTSASHDVVAVYVGPGAPDFAVTAIELVPPSPPPGSTFTARVTVANLGDAAGVPGRLRIYPDRPEAAGCDLWSPHDVSLPALGSGESLVATVPGLPAGSSGAKTLRAFIEPRCFTDEAAEANNQAALAYEVVEPNRPPALDPVADQAVAEGELLAFAVSATDPDGEAVSLAVENAPEGAAFDPATGAFAWRPRLDQAGVYPGVTFVGTDAGGLSDARSVTITVGESAAPLFTDTFADAGPAGDPDWQALSGAWTGARGAWLAGSTKGANLAQIGLFDPVALPLGAGLVRARVKLTAVAGRAGPNAMVVFALRDAAHYRWVRITPSRISIGQTGELDGVAAGAKAVFSRRTAVGKWQALAVAIHPDGWVRVYRDGAARPLARFRFAGAAGPSVVPGGVGLAAVKARALFDDASVWSDAALPLP